MNEETICPHCGAQTPNFNFCANCGKPIEDLSSETGPETTDSQEEILIATIKALDASKRKFIGEPKNIFFTNHYMVEYKGSRFDYSEHITNLEKGGLLMLEDINEKIDLKSELESLPDPKVIAYSEIEKAEFYVSRGNVFLEITAASFTPKYSLASKKYADQFREKLRNLLEPKIGDRFIVK
jgi:hypothetical protein